MIVSLFGNEMQMIKFRCCQQCGPITNVTSVPKSGKLEHRGKQTKMHCEDFREAATYKGHQTLGKPPDAAERDTTGSPS